MANRRHQRISFSAIHKAKFRVAQLEAVWLAVAEAVAEARGFPGGPDPEQMERVAVDIAEVRAAIDDWKREIGAAILEAEFEARVRRRG